MATTPKTPLVAGFLYPPQVDVDRFLSRVGPSGAATARPIEVVRGFYFEDHGLRTTKASERDPDRLRPHEPELTPETRDVLAQSEVLLALDVPCDLRTLAPNLRWIQAVGAGTNQFDMDALGKMGVRLTSSAGVGAPPIAEFVMGRILEVWKDIRALEELQRARRWEFTQGRLLMGSTIGIVGLGAIGSEIAKRAKAFGMHVLAIRRSHRPGMTADNVDELFGPGPDGLGELLRRCDVIVLSAPATAETTDLIGVAELNAMKPGAVLVNVARGPLVDEAALIAALVDGHLGAAILDVTRTEPLPSDDPLWDAPRLYLSPHCSTSQDGYNDRLLDLYADNLTKYLASEPLKNLVT